MAWASESIPSSAWSLGFDLGEEIITHVTTYSGVPECTEYGTPENR